MAPKPTHEELEQRAIPEQEVLVQRVAHLQTLTYLNQLVSSSLEVDKVLCEIAKAAARLMNASIVTIWVADETTQTLEIQAFSEERMDRDFLIRKQPFGKGGVGWVAEHRQPLNIPDVFVDKRITNLDWWQAFGLKSFFGFPIYLDHSLVAVLGLGNQEPFHFKSEDQILLENLAAQAAIAIKNARLFEKIRKQTVKLEQINTELRREAIEHKQAEEALRSLSSNQEALLSAIPDIIMEVDSNKVYTWANQPGMEFFGEDVIGKEADFYFEGEQDTYNEVQPLFNGSENVIYVESWQRRRDGQKRLLAWWCRVLKDARGNVIGAISSARDITERKQEEQALRKSEEKYKTILASIEDSYFEVNQRGEITFFNEAFSEIIGYPPDELMGMKNDKYLDQENRIKVFKKFNEVWKTGIPTKLFEYEVIRKNGEKRTVQTSASLMTDENGQKTGFRGIIRDISDHKLMEKALQESEEKYRSMMGSMKDPAYICSPDFRVEYMNPAMIKRTGRDATGELCYKVINECEEKCLWCVHDKVMQGDYKITEIISPKDGHYYSVSHSPIHHVDGSISKFTLYRDVTELKKLEQQLQQAMKMESIGTLAGGIAHDFNNILSPIMVYSEMAMMDLPSGSPLQQNMKQIYKAGERARDLVKQILTFARKQEKEQIPIKVSQILKEAIKLIRSSIPSIIDIQYDINSEQDTVLADPTQLNQIIMNLCTNASHAMEEKGGTLEVMLTNENLDSESADEFPDLEPGRYVKLSVRDTGYGIESQFMNKIFEPYFTTKEVGKGTGMGLAIVHGIVESYGGAVTVQSEMGKGTSFHVYLPLVEDDAAVLETATDAVQLHKGTERVLFVDDEKGAVDAMQLMLENLGYKVTARTSSIEALEAFRNNPQSFDLVITDMTMPNMTGKDLAKELMGIRPDIPIILCTGFSEKIDERRATEMGIHAFVMKPIVMRDMANTIREVLDKK